MPDYLIDVELAAKSGIARDSVHNSFCVSGPVIAQGNTLPVVNALDSFYNNTGVADLSLAIATYISQSRSRELSACPVRIYDISGNLGGTPHGSPVATDALTLRQGGSNPSLPEECAVVLTLRAAGYQNQPIEGPDNADPDIAPERPRQTYTGRIYLGPLVTIAGVTEASTSVARPAPAFRSTILASADRLRDQWAAAGYVWMMWSRERATVRNVTRAEVDDAWDTQRRRGVDPTVREFVSLV